MQKQRVGSGPVSSFVIQKLLAVVALATIAFTAGALAQSSVSTDNREPFSEAWWTGPLLANSAATLPHGHFLIEPYVYDVISSNTNALGSRAYVEYGLIDKLTVGLIPIIGYNVVTDGPNSSGIRFGDFTPIAQYRLRKFREGSWLPMMAVQVQQTFPTGKYDQLGDRPSDGLGSGVYSTLVGVNNQTYFWMPNGRILRMRFNVAETFSTKANIQDVSVYGTTTGFRGYAYPGAAFSIDAAWEYSLTQRWVLALDVIYNQRGNTPVTGYNIQAPDTSIRLNSGSSAGAGCAPAIEYNWNSRWGVIFGTRVIAPGRNTTSSVAPVAAINIVL